MVPKTGNQFRNRPPLPSEADFARTIGMALRSELGLSRRATKTVMAWAGVSDRTARGWLYGSHSPGGLHLISLSTHSREVMDVFLTLTGHDTLKVAFDLAAIETELERALEDIRGFIGEG
jgi:hypothetical protein